MAAITSQPKDCLAAFDYDGTLAPIVADPERARPHPRIPGALTRVAARVGTVAVLTGRPAQTAVDLAGFIGTAGLDSLVVVGHYGLERWDASSQELTRTSPPAGLDAVRHELPGLLARLGLGDATVEDKVLSVAVHVRRMADPETAYQVLVQPLTELAERHGLVAEPGRLVLEVRAGEMDKGRALRALVEERAARSVIFVGDDLGDLAAFDEVDRLRDGGVPGLLVCSASDEVTALAERSDLVVDGPAGVADFMDELAAALAG
jgi:trehalose 6-phosphate phosphatase